VTWVKVCGLSTHETVRAAEESGADAVGFVLVPSSPRVVTLALAGELIEASSADSYVLTLDVGVAEGVEILRELDATGVQPYGEGRRAFAEAALHAGFKVLYPIPVSGQTPPDAKAVPAGAVPLFDHSDPDALGGTGRTFAWSALNGAPQPYVAAGGLSPDNVRDLVRSFAPWGVDASSGLEISPGVKDVHTIRAFVKAAKQA